MSNQMFDVSFIIYKYVYILLFIYYIVDKRSTYTLNEGIFLIIFFYTALLLFYF